MADSASLSVRLTKRTRKLLDDLAADYQVVGASTLARVIIERWAEREVAARLEADIARVRAYLDADPIGWKDDPNDFFPHSS